jgi:PIN domain nuclease of toxin-antitoxin system
MIVLDTHAWVWWLGEPARLTDRARAAIDGAARDNALLISSISAWEVALLVRRRRLTLDLPFSDWLRQAEALPFVTYVPIDNAIAVRSVALPPPLHQDPADRIITATTLQAGGRLVTRDQALRDYPHVATIW